MPNAVSRRQWLIMAGASSATTMMGGRRALSANDKLDVAAIGIGGRGRANLNGVAKLGQNIVALCDVDDKRAGDAYQRFPEARKFYDFRRMFDEMGDKIDAVLIGTPDHTHFHAALWALRAGKHVYVEKPMAHSPWEVRTLTDLAREKGVATQLGTQRHTLKAMHAAVEIIRAGVIGRVSEVYAWVSSSRGMPAMPMEFPPVPPTLKWDLWLGPAPEHPYHPSYCPYGWRFWWDFGTGETGNWGCHVLDTTFWALGLRYPTKVEATGPPVDPQRTPKSLNSRFEFPAPGGGETIVLHWLQTADSKTILADHGITRKVRGINTLFVGERGKLVAGFSNWKLFPEADFKDFKLPEPTIPPSPGFHREWVDACRGGKPATCHFDYSGPLTETVLLANVAYRAGGFEWDAKTLTARGNPNAQALIHPPFRKGWEV